jgi:plasmid stabilization system protein ParE
MSGFGSDPEILTTYAVRIEVRAERDIQEALLRIAEFSGDEIARTWIAGLYEAFAKLGTLPYRCPVIEEARSFTREVRQLQYKRTANAPAYRILFTIVENGDGRMVSILHVRHAARKPVTRKEAKEIL